MQHTATHCCNTLHHTTTHCNTLQLVLQVRCNIETRGKESRKRKTNVGYVYGSCRTTHSTPFHACTSTILSFGTAKSKVAYIYRSCRITHSACAHQLCSVLALKRFQIQFRSELKTPETRGLANVAIVSPKNPRIYERGRAAARRIIR